MHAIEGQRWLALLRGRGEELLRGLEQVDERHALQVSRHLGHRRGVEREVGVVLQRQAQVGIWMILVRDGREQHDARRPEAIVVFRAGVAQELFELLLELRQSGGAAERFVEAEEREDRARLHARQPLVGRAEILGTRPHRDFVPGEGEIPHDEAVLRMLRVDHRLEPAVMLHPVGERIADDRDMLAWREGHGVRARCRDRGGQPDEAAGEQMSEREMRPRSGRRSRVGQGRHGGRGMLLHCARSPLAHKPALQHRPKDPKHWTDVLRGPRLVLRLEPGLSTGWTGSTGWGTRSLRLRRHSGPQPEFIL